VFLVGDLAAELTQSGDAERVMWPRDEAYRATRDHAALGVEEVFRAVREMLRLGRHDAALRALMAVFVELVWDSRLGGTQFPFPAFDRICGEIGATSAFELLADRGRVVATPHDLVVVTEAAAPGGHTAIIRDLADFSTQEIVIVATNLYERADSGVVPVVARHQRVADVVTLRDGDLGARMRGLQAMMANSAVQRVILLCHAHDAVAIAAAAAVDDKPVLFIHHCDHTPALGCFLPHAVHVDVHNVAFEQCRMSLGLDPGYLCLTSRGGAIPADAGRPRMLGRFADPVFKSVTCGHEHKLTCFPYPISYAEVVERLISVRGGVHFHVGALSDGFVEALRDRLERARLPRDSLVVLGHVSSFQDTLEALEADLYVPTLPQSGQKAEVDAMCAGVPILVHENAIDRIWGGRDMVYPEAASWTTLSGLEACLDRFANAAYWREQARCSRAYFETHYSPALFARMLAANGRLQRGGMPPLQPYRPDHQGRQRALVMLAQIG
jgi:hypothetical protein